MRQSYNTSLWKRKILWFCIIISELELENVCCVSSFTNQPMFMIYISYDLHQFYWSKKNCWINFSLCGNYGDNLKNPYKITSTTNLAAIHFRSSSKNEFKGFSCKWTVETARTVPYSKEGKFNGERKFVVSLYHLFFLSET